MNINIIQENSKDYKSVNELVEAAFKTAEYSDQTEHLLVQRLRESKAFVPELSMVAMQNDEVVGHILLTKIQVKESDRSYEGLALAPVSVHPDFQKKGIGGRLIKKSHEIAGALGYKFIVLLGHPDYYPKFGYQPASKYGIRFPFEAPDEACMVFALFENALDGISGEVVYDPAFGL